MLLKQFFVNCFFFIAYLVVNRLSNCFNLAKFWVPCQGVRVAAQVDQACREQECSGAELNALLSFDFRQNPGGQ